MADGCFNISKGKIKYYTELPATNDALIIVLLKSAGLEADATLADHDNLSVLLAATNDEADATNYVRKSLTTATNTVDDTNNWLDVDITDQVWTNLGGATNNTLGKLLVCYDPDTTVGTDTTVVPLTYHDFAVTSDGSSVTAEIASLGFFRAA